MCVGARMAFAAITMVVNRAFLTAHRITYRIAQFSGGGPEFRQVAFSEVLCALRISLGASIAHIPKKERASTALECGTSVFGM